MAKYRQKDDVDIRWNRIRRRITRELDTQLADWREDALNRLLSGAWTEYVKAIGSGDVLELEAHYTTWVAQALNDVIEVPVEAPDAA